MGFKRNNAEGGSNTTAVTTGNSGGGSGDAFSSVSAGAGGTITFSSTQAAHGSLAYAIASAATTANSMILTDVSTGTSFTVRAYVYLTGSPSATTIFIQVQTSGGTNVARLHLNTSRQLQVVNQAGSAVATFTNAIPLNTWTRITFTGTVNATTGTLTAAIYPGDSLTATETKNLTNQNTGSTAAARCVYGKQTASCTLATFYLDDIAQDMTVATEIGPALHDGAGTVAATSDLAGAATTLLQAAGSVDSSADGTGAGTAVAAGAGLTAASSSGSGSGSMLAAGAGVAAATSSSSGAATVISGSVTHDGAGTVAGTSGQVGAATAVARSAGTVAAVSGSSGAATVIARGAGSTAGVSSSSGASQAVAAGSGTSAASSSSVGAASSLLVSAGTLAAMAAVEGSATLLASAAGSCDAISTVVGSAVVDVPPRDVQLVSITGRPRVTGMRELQRGVATSSRSRTVTLTEVP